MAHRPFLALVHILLFGLCLATQNQQEVFFKACKNGDLLTVRALVSSGANISAHDEDGLEPLHWAARRNMLDVARLLLEKGADLEACDKDGCTPLFYAVDEGHLELAHFLLEQGADVDARDEDGSTPLLWAADTGHLELTRLLLERGASVDARSDVEGSTPLCWAAYKGHVEVTRLLLKQGADVDARDKDRSTPLLWAAQEGHLEVTRLLLEQGADVEAHAKDGSTALSCAVEKGNVRVVRLLLRQGANLEDREEDGSTPLSWAAYEGHLEMTRLLLEQGAKVDAQDKDGWTPLPWAVYMGQLEVVRLLLEQGANVEARAKDDSTPLSWAAYVGHVEIARLLLQNGANVDARESHGWEPLHLAAHSGKPDVARLLLQKDANMEARDADGWAPLHIAAFAGDGEMVSLLLENHTDAHARDEAGFCAGNLAEARGFLAVAMQLLPCTRTGGEWLRHTATSRGFWLALGLAMVLLFATTRWLARAQSGFEPLAPVGATLLAATAVYPPWALLAVKLYRAVEVFSNTALPMYLMYRLSPAIWGLVLLLIYSLPALASGGSDLLQRPLLVLAASRHSLLRLGRWDRGLLGFLWAPGRLGLLLGLAYLLRPSQYVEEPVKWHPHKFVLHTRAFRHCSWCNPRGEEAVLVTGTNPRNDLCLPLPEAVSESLQKWLWRHRPPWEVAQGNCTREAASLCITSPGFPDESNQSETCRITVPTPATFLLKNRAFNTVSKHDVLVLNGENYTGEDGPSGMVPMGDILWRSEKNDKNARNPQAQGGWRLCPDKKRICFPFWSVKALSGVFRATSMVIVLTYTILSLVLLAAALQPAVFKCRRDHAPAVANVTAEILTTIEEHPAPEQAVTVLSQIPGSGGRFVVPTSVLQTSIFLLLDLVLDLNTVRVLMVSENYMFAAIIAAASIGSTVIELQHGGLSEVMSAIRETRRTGVPTAAYMRMMGAEKGEAWVSLLVTSYAVPFSVRSPLDLVSVSLSLLSSSWSLASYLLEELDVGTAAFSSKTIEIESGSATSASDSCSESESHSDASCTA